MSEKTEVKNVEKYPQHYAKVVEIVKVVNELSGLINELGELEKTGNENIDNIHISLGYFHKKTISVFEVE